MALGYGLPTCNNNNNCATLQLRCVDVHVYSVRTCRQEQGWRWRSAIHILGLSGCCACYEGCHVRRCYRCCGAQAPAVAAPMTAAGHCFFFLFFGLESLHAHRCQSCQQPERQIKQTTGEFRVHSTSYDKGSCFAMA